jgi:hypothetical protein
MGAVLITCSNTGREFSTGILAEEDTFNCMPDVLARSRCPYCGLQHSWWKRDARYVDSIPQSQWVETRAEVAPVAGKL